MRIALKILLFPVALLCMALALFILAAGNVLLIGIRLLAGLFTLGVLFTLIHGILQKDMSWSLIFNGTIIIAVLTALSMFIESLPDALSRFSGWVRAL